MLYNDSSSAVHDHGRFIDLAVEGRVDVTLRTLTIILRKIAMGKTKTEINLTISSNKNTQKTPSRIYRIIYIYSIK